MSTRLFQVRFNNWQAASPLASGGKRQVLQQLINYIRALLASTLSNPVVVYSEYSQVAATGSVAVADGGSSTQTITLNGVGSAVTWATSTNNAANQLVSAVNSATNALVYQHATASRDMVNALGTYTIDGSVTGTITATIASTAVAVASTAGDVSASARTLVAAINLNGTVGPKVFATSALGVVTLTASGYGRATVAISTGSGKLAILVNGFETSVTATGVDATDATALALAINANPAVNRLVRATSSSGTVTVIALAVPTLPSVGSTGTGTTTGVAGPLTTITLSGASGTITAVINGVRIPVTYATSVTVTAALLVAAINANTNVNRLVNATSSAGVVTVRALSAVTISSAGTGAGVASSAVLVSSGTWGGVAGNAISTTASGTGLTADQSVLAGGTTAVTLTAVNPGHAGNAVTLAASGNALTAGAARLAGGTATQATSTFPG